MYHELGFRTSSLERTRGRISHKAPRWLSEQEARLRPQAYPRRCRGTEVQRNLAEGPIKAFVALISQKQGRGRASEKPARTKSLQLRTSRHRNQPFRVPYSKSRKVAQSEYKVRRRNGCSHTTTAGMKRGRRAHVPAVSSMLSQLTPCFSWKTPGENICNRSERLELLAQAVHSFPGISGVRSIAPGEVALTTQPTAVVSWLCVRIRFHSLVCSHRDPRSAFRRSQRV